jgi:hypothetical protein
VNSRLPIIVIASAMLAVVVAALPFAIDAATSIRSTHYASTEDEAAAMRDFSDTIVARLTEIYPEGDLPIELGYSHGVLTTPDGDELARLPEGTRVHYALVANDDFCEPSRDFELELVGPDSAEHEADGWIEWSVTDEQVFGPDYEISAGTCD